MTIKTQAQAILKRASALLSNHEAANTDEAISRAATQLGYDGYARLAAGDAFRKTYVAHVGTGVDVQSWPELLRDSAKAV